MRITITRRQKITFILAALLLSLNFMMRYGVWKRIQYYTLEKTRYEKLILSYHLSGQGGVKYELANILKHNPSAAGFISKAKEELKNAKDTELFLHSAIAADRKRIERLRMNRLMISIAIYVIIASQILFNLAYWFYHDRRIGGKK
jgi:hypothetical protein